MLVGCNPDYDGHYQRSGQQFLVKSLICTIQTLQGSGIGGSGAAIGKLLSAEVPVSLLPMPVIISPLHGLFL